MESIQYNAAAITGVIGGTLKDRFYKELSFESLQSRRWFQRSLSYKTIKKRSSTLFLNWSRSHQLYTLHVNLVMSKNTYFSSKIVEWNFLDSNTRVSPSYLLFLKRILELKILRTLDPSKQHFQCSKLFRFNISQQVTSWFKPFGWLQIES